MFHIILAAASGSLSSMRGNGCPATYPTIVSLFGARRTCDEYFSVASLYGGGQSIRPVGMIFIDIPLTTRQYSPGETRSFTLVALSGVMTSPGLTCAEAGNDAANIKDRATKKTRARLGGKQLALCIATLLYRAMRKTVKLKRLRQAAFRTRDCLCITSANA